MHPKPCVLLQALAHVQPVPVWLPKQGSVVSALDEAVRTAAETGHPVKALLLTNPRNPEVRPHPTNCAASEREPVFIVLQNIIHLCWELKPQNAWNLRPFRGETSHMAPV